MKKIAKMNPEAQIHDLAQRLVETCAARQFTIALAESCTGGWIAKAITDIPGSSAVLDRGFVTYSNQAKQEMLGVSLDTLAHHGAVSQPTVAAMVTGAITNSRANLAAAVSGIAGPGGGSLDKPVGTVCFAWLKRGDSPKIEQSCLQGDRNKVRMQTVELALRGLLKYAQSSPSK